jgi:hypothetical protein
MPSWVIGIIAAGIGAFLGSSITQILSWSALWASYNEAATKLVLDIDRLFVEHPELRPYLLDGGSSGEDVVFTHRADAVVELIADCLEGIWDNRDLYGKDDRESWRRYIMDLRSTMPQLDSFIDDNSKWYPSLCLLDEPRRRAPRARRIWDNLRGKR